MNKAFIFFAILAIVACVSALQQPPKMVGANILECEGMQNPFFSLLSVAIYLLLS
jgi:hypothetical protein